MNYYNVSFHHKNWSPNTSWVVVKYNTTLLGIKVESWKPGSLREKINHFPPLVVVDLIKQVNLWWGLAFKGRESVISIFRAWGWKHNKLNTLRSLCKKNVK
jgi:hypothetical protein